MNDFFLKNHRSRSPWIGSAGFNLVSVMIALALLMITAWGISQGLVFSKQTQNDAAIRQSANRFLDTMRNILAKRARNYVIDDCSGGRYSTGRSGGGISGAGAGSIGTNPLQNAFATFNLSSVSGEGAASMAFTQSPVAKASVHAAAAERCKYPKNKGAYGAGEYSYFCMNFAADSSYKTKKSTGSSSFWLLDSSFMEVMLIPVELVTDNPIKCQDVTDSGAQGIKILYSIYYANKSGNRDSGGNDIYFGKQMNGVFYVSGQP